MLPIKLTAADPENERRRYKIVRADMLTDVGPPEALILSASVETGECELGWTVNGEPKQEKFYLLADGLRIVTR
jgi:hypothetical protein